MYLQYPAVAADLLALALADLGRAGEALEARRDDAAARLANLDALVLADWRGALAGHLAACALPELGDRLAGEPAAELLLKSYAGLAKKVEYLDGLAESGVGRLERDLEAELRKLEHDVSKYSRPKKAWATFDAASFEHRFRDRAPRLEKHWQRYRRGVDTIYAFDRYERAGFAEDFLWWDLMTDGRIDGDFLPEVADYRARYPDRRWAGAAAADLDDDRAAAAAVAAERQSAGGPGGGGLDAS